MTSDELDEVRAFLGDHVSGFEELEVLLFFVRAPRRVWRLAELAEALKLSTDVLEAALRQLTSAGVPLTPTSDPTTPAYRYAPTPQTERLLDMLLRAYDEERLTILQIMSSNAMERVRSMAASRLADAFRLDRSKK